jgi:creatinine amidohydrolase
MWDGHEIFLERLTWPEVREALDEGRTTVIVPCGAVEQHGPHLPLLVDAEHGAKLGEEVARRLGNALVAPPIRVGCSEHHMAFPGTVSIRPATLEALCQDYCMSLSRHGFRRICLLPSHGGNFKVLAEMVQGLNDVVGPSCTVVAFTDLIGMLETWKRVVEEEAGLGARVGGHADIAESSVLLSIHPDLVKPELAEKGYIPDMRGEVVDRIIQEGFQTVTPNGILGDARGMTREIGERCITEVAEMLVAFFRE